MAAKIPRPQDRRLGIFAARDGHVNTVYVYIKLTTYIPKCLIVLITEIYFITSDIYKRIRYYLHSEMTSTDGLLKLKDPPTFWSRSHVWIPIFRRILPVIINATFWIRARYNVWKSQSILIKHNVHSSCSRKSFNTVSCFWKSFYFAFVSSIFFSQKFIKFKSRRSASTILTV